ncbi:hypothetical protein [Kitasatospora sp. NPDC004289]
MYKPTAALRTLSEIVISANVGAIHLRRVGELLVARAELSNRILYSDRKINVPDEFLADLMFGTTAVEQSYVSAWEACESGTDEWRTSEGLPALDSALRRAAEYFLEIAGQA